MALWSTKAAISLKRVQIEEKLLRGAYSKSGSPVMLRWPHTASPRLGFAPHPKIQSLLSQEWAKLRTSNLIRTFIWSIGTKAPKNLRNSSSGLSQELPIIFRAPIYRAHCVVVFAIAQLSGSYRVYCSLLFSCYFLKCVAFMHSFFVVFLLCSILHAVWAANSLSRILVICVKTSKLL